MRSPPPASVEFVVGEYDVLVGPMAAMAATGIGWVNARPIVDEEHQPEAPGPFAIFGGSIHKIPTATWVPGKHGADGTVKPTSVGLQHSSGPRVVARLRELGLPMPDGWRITQDHPRRGLVALVPVEASDADTVDWLVRAATVVSAVPVTGRWSGSIHAGSGGGQ